MRSNYLYILILIILFIYLYAEYENRIHFDNLDNYDAIAIDLESNIIKTDVDGVIDHLVLLKENLLLLNKMPRAIDKTTMVKVDSIIKTCLYGLDSFKRANQFNNDSLCFSPSHISQYLCGKLQESSENMARSDILDYQYEKYEIMDVITNIEIVILLIINGKRNGIINLSDLHDLIKICSTLSNGAKYLSYDEVFSYEVPDQQTVYNIHEYDDYLSPYTNDYGKEHSKLLHTRLNKSNISHDDGFNTLYGEGEKYTNDNATIICDRVRKRHNAPITMDNNHYNTQWLSSSDVSHTVKRNGIKNYVPFHDINKILAEIKYVKQHTTDSIAKRSLCNDYKF